MISFPEGTQPSRFSDPYGDHIEYPRLAQSIIYANSANSDPFFSSPCANADADAPSHSHFSFLASADPLVRAGGSKMRREVVNPVGPARCGGSRPPREKFHVCVYVTHLCLPCLTPARVLSCGGQTPVSKLHTYTHQKKSGAHAQCKSRSQSETDECTFFFQSLPSGRASKLLWGTRNESVVE